MSDAQKTIQQQGGGIIMPLLKVLLVVVALFVIGWSVVTIDLPNARYFWIVFEVVVALLLIPVAINSIRQMFGGKR